MPPIGLTINVRRQGEEDWKTVDTISRGGKASAASWHYMNVKDSDNPPQCISLKKAEWHLIEEKQNPVETPPEDVFLTCLGQGIRFEKARNEELEKWKEMETYTETDDTGQVPRVSSRWVYTEKLKGGEVIAKARLVARGFEEVDPQIKTDSPTCQKESLRLLLAIIAAYNWKLQSIDIKSAYLQGILINRMLYLEPPPEAKAEGKIWLLHKCPYGISDAGRHWYDRIVEVFVKELNGHQLKLDQAVFVWHNPDNTLMGAIVVHVDDFIFGGTSEFQIIINKIKKEFTVGTEESGSMKYLGLSVKQTPEYISMDSSGYNDCIKEIIVPHLPPNTELDKQMTRRLRKLSGQINWLASQTRIDLAYDNCIVANSIAGAQTKDLLYANKVVRKATNSNTNGALFFPSHFDMNSCHIIAFGDSSLANLRDKGSQGGHIVLLVDANGAYSIAAWRSKRIKRVVRSTLAAECCAVNDAVDSAVYIRHLLREITNINPPLHVFNDNKSLVNAAHSSTSVEEKALQLHVAELRDHIKRGEIAEFRWVASEKNLADYLTKAALPQKLLCSVLQPDMRFDITTGNFFRPQLD